MKSFFSMRKAEDMEKAGDLKGALALFRAATGTLTSIKQTDPTWNAEILDFRLKATFATIDRIQAKLGGKNGPARGQRGAAGAYPLQVKRWQGAKVDPRHQMELDGLVGRYLRTKGTYDKIAKMRANGVPSAVVFALHYRECGNRFDKSPAQGDPLDARSTHVPRGRIPGINPPYDFLVSAYDSYYAYEHLEQRDWSTIGGTLEAIEGFNGMGYRSRGVPSPYVWSGTTIYRCGKYTEDGHYDPTKVDRQLGVAAILMRMKEQGIHVSPAFQ